ncbi:MAG TPA: alcohol dehydrogenase, partial [Lachnospiraceae bacterium]|nr:alcohol dehydrogenase [Lachnospiraceae bacterium]
AKLAHSQETFGFAGTILNEGPESMEKAVKEITGFASYNGTETGYGFDVCIEAVGLPSTFQACIDCAAFGGKVVLIGVGKKNLDFNFTLIQKKELNVYGSRNALKKDFLELINLVKDGKVDLEKIITDIYPFKDAAKAFEDFSTKGGQMLKVGIDFSDIHMAGETN